MADRFHATVAPVVLRHEHHVWHGPAGEPALPDGDHELDGLEGVTTWTMPDGTIVGYVAGYFGPARPDEEPLHRIEEQQIERPGFEWRVEDTQAGYVHVGFAEKVDDAVADAKAWVAGQLAAPAPVEAAKTMIDLGDVFRFAGIDPKG